MMKCKAIMTLGTIVVLSGCFGVKKEKKGSNSHADLWSLQHMDTSLSPSSDFYLYSNGGWLQSNSIPSDESTWGIFSKLGKENDLKLKQILNEILKGNFEKSTPAYTVARFYQSSLDTATLDKRGLEPILPFLKGIDTLQSPMSFWKFESYLATLGMSVCMNFGKDADLQNSKLNALYIGQGGIGLPERDYYFDLSERFEKYRKAYLDYIQTLFLLSGSTENQAKVQANAVLEIEKSLAKSHMPLVQMRDPYQIYHPFTEDSLIKSFPGFPWKQLCSNLGIYSGSTFIVMQPDYIQNFLKTMQTMPLEKLRWFYRFHLLRQNANALSLPFRNAHFQMYSKVLKGIEQKTDRAEEMAALTGYFLSDAVSELYVQKYFSAEAKVKAEILVQNLRNAFAERIKKNEWMSDSTKRKALYKLNKIICKIGYPEVWKKYDEAKIEPDQFFENCLQLSALEIKRQMATVGKTVDKKEWFMPAHMVNAYYNPSFNEIVFPAAILQPPFFDPKADDALNYGGIGAVIGHELTHGFDDQGSQYDADGNLKSWWTVEDRKRFETKAQQMVEQYNQYKVLDSVSVNGKLTLGENIADLGGISLAYDALQLALKTQKPNALLRFTPEQRLFLAWSRVWCGKYRDDALAARIKTDPHAPMMFRAIGPLENLSSFEKAFHINQKSKHFRVQKIKIW